jgi:hypothetical protein
VSQKPIHNIVYTQPIQYTEKHKIVDKIKERFTDRDHIICIDWLNKKPHNHNTCPFLHEHFNTFKVTLCSHWKSGTCPYESIKCRYAHGYSYQDPFSRVQYNPDSIEARIEQAARI